MILGGLTLARCNVTVNMTMAVGERKNHFYLPLFFNMFKQFLAPEGLSAECVQVSVI